MRRPAAPELDIWTMAPARSDRQSTILPFALVAHWEPTTTTFDDGRNNRFKTNVFP
jgi:hypothetical protein